ncbi:hypothetical protein LTR66_010427 [Elasticomyces elasticus]|nr:hypothetical protein LTR66_010427 [Elasticomyces elasticus]
MSTGKAGNQDLKASKLFDVSHITAIVTGGGTGIGLMITQALVANGAKVYITGRREEMLEKVVEQYSTGPGSIHALSGDVSDKSDVERLAKEMASKEPKGIQLLVNNAGIARDQNTQFCTYESRHSTKPWHTRVNQPEPGDREHPHVLAYGPGRRAVAIVERVA